MNKKPSKLGWEWWKKAEKLFTKSSNLGRFAKKKTYRVDKYIKRKKTSNWVEMLRIKINKINKDSWSYNRKSFFILKVKKLKII